MAACSEFCSRSRHGRMVRAARSRRHARRACAGESRAQDRKEPEAGLIYSDEDKIDLAGNRSNPFFKMDWNPELFLGQNYIDHLGVYRTDIFARLADLAKALKVRRTTIWLCAVSNNCDRPNPPYPADSLPRAHGLRQPGGKTRCQAVCEGGSAWCDYGPPTANSSCRPGRPCPENIESHRVVYELPDPAPRVADHCLSRR